MPRKERLRKNPYCYRSRLSGSEFSDLVWQFLANASVSDATRALNEKEIKISRQSVSKYFLNLGYHLFLNHYIPDAMLILLKREPEGTGIPINRTGGFSYTFAFAEQLIDELGFDERRTKRLKDELIQIPFGLKEHLETHDSEGKYLIEDTLAGAVISKLRDNHFLVSVLRDSNRRSFGYANEHFLSLFAKVYFVEAYATMPESNLSDLEIVDEKYGRLIIRELLLTGLRENPMSFKLPSDYRDFIEEYFGLEQA